MNSVSTRRVTEKTAVVCMAVNMGSNVMKVYLYLNDFDLFSKGVLLIYHNNIIEHNWVGLT